MIKRVLNVLALVYRKFRTKINWDKNIYLVYTMGKVGSSTIYHAIKRNKPYSSVFHIHFLSDNWLKGILPSLTKHFQKNISLGEEILEEIERNPDKRLKVITLSREPVSLAISDLFENWEQHYTDIESVSNEELKNHIEQVDHEYSLNWFDSEFFNYLGIDLYNLPFDREKGYEIYNFEKLDILCIKLESLNQVSAKAFREFIDIDMELVDTNTSSSKKGMNKYAQLKQDLRLDPAKLKELYDSKYMQHFYTEEEIEGFVKKWS